MSPAPPRAPLAEYDRKRDFAQTPEPGPDAAALASPRPRFMVHKHHARRLHYDLRLEIDGALASWAVPRGPSFDPAVKRLAVQTEDHPLAYGDFEGRIPDAQYGAGDSLVWDRGYFDTVPPGQVGAMRRKGHIQFELWGEKLRGQWHLLRTTAADGRRAAQGDASASGPKSQWLLVKVADAAADPALDITVARPASVLTGRVETLGPDKASGPESRKPSMPVLLATGVLGQGPAGPADKTRAPIEHPRIPTPLFAAIPLAQLQVDLARPQQLLELPGHLFGEEPPILGGPSSSASPGGGAAPFAELLLLLERPGAPARDRTLGEVAEVALVLRELFTSLGLHALACAGGRRALLLRVPIAPAPDPAALDQFTARIAETLAAQLAPLREGRVLLLRAADRWSSKLPTPLEPLPGEKQPCVPLAWEEVGPALSLAKFTARWLAGHRAEAEARVAAHRAAAAPLPRVR